MVWHGAFVEMRSVGIVTIVAPAHGLTGFVHTWYSSLAQKHVYSQKLDAMQDEQSVVPLLPTCHFHS